jgi:hypothetical protein
MPTPSSPPPATTDNIKEQSLGFYKSPGMSPQQEIAIPYVPCVRALGWVNGHLRCDNRY